MARVAVHRWYGSMLLSLVACFPVSIFCVACEDDRSEKICKEAAYTGRAPMAVVVGARRTIGAGNKIEQGDVANFAIDQNKKPEGSYSDASQVIGMTAKYDIVPGQIIGWIDTVEGDPQRASVAPVAPEANVVPAPTKSPLVP